MEKVSNSDSILQVRIKEKSFGYNMIIKDLSINIKQGEFVSILGKSGIGKSTFFKVISGVDTDYIGDIIFKNKRMVEPNKSISLMFQGHFLLPWLTVKENIKFFNNEIDDDKVANYLQSVGIANKENEWPNCLSGGEKTRVGLSVAIINKAELLLLDEPFSDIDIGVKMNIIKLLQKMKVQNNITIIMTTHNIEDALLLSDRILVFGDNPSKIVLDSINKDNNKKNLRDKIISILSN